MRRSQRSAVTFAAALSAMLLSAHACAQREPPNEPPKPAEKVPPDTSSGWPRPRSSERLADRKAMVQRHIAARGVRDKAVLEAMVNVPRHWFVPSRRQSQAYADHPLPIGAGQTISQPYIVAFMTEALRLESDSKVLEIGTGSWSMWGSNI